MTPVVVSSGRKQRHYASATVQRQQNTRQAPRCSHDDQIAFVLSPLPSSRFWFCTVAIQNRFLFSCVCDRKLVFVADAVRLQDALACFSINKLFSTRIHSADSNTLEVFLCLGPGVFIK